MSEFSAATPAPDPAQRLQPPGGGAILTLEAPAPPPVVQATQAPEMAPPVTEEQRPVLDAKVTQFITTRAKNPAAGRSEWPKGFFRAAARHRRLCRAHFFNLGMGGRI